ncbi:hypothetical protein [Roseisolibacter sp. H3M3-2]|uniref:hypothetical protein n=1 Tax=Roseisolibacter sp. H3M3-2 TaxID=3031323 RepID=UPI0023D9CB22|nr:hypothetical protein [Roseisolibacter sp. H3M3-2]MDF1502846.1 hypothetical protein [Roseisolibacter sp. H3M3-2]
MRAFFRRSLLAAAAVVAVAAPLAARAHTPAAPADTAAATTAAKWVGVYRVTIAQKQGDVLDARVLIEPNGQQLMGMLLVDQHASGITDVQVQGEALVATVVTAEGRGKLTLRTDEAGVSGTLQIGKRTWQVTGARAI